MLPTDSSNLHELKCMQL